MSAAVAPVLYSADGRPLTRGVVPDPDPTFLLSFAERMATASQLFKRALEQPYRSYVWVYACCALIASNLARLQPLLYNPEKPSDELRKHPFLKLLRRPNPYMTGSQFWEAVILNLLLPTQRSPGGQCFLIPDDDVRGAKTNFARGDIPKSLYPFSDRWVFPKVENGVLRAWELRIPGAPIMALQPEEVIRIHLYNPYDLLSGLSPYTAAQYSVESDLKSSELSRKFSDNHANIGGMLTTDKTLATQTADELRRSWEERYGGPQNSGRTAILHSGLKYEATAKSLGDLQWIDQRRLNREEVLASYRVPEFALGLGSDVNFATSVQAMRTLWNDTLIPYGDRMWEPINSQWVENIDGGRWLGYFDLSQVESLRKDYKDKVLIAGQMVQHGIPVAEAYSTLDIPVDAEKSPWLKEPLVLGSRVNLRTGEVIGQPTFDLGLGGGDGDDGEGEPEGDQPPVGDGEKGAEVRFLERARAHEQRADEREKFWLEWVKRTLAPGERSMQTSLTRYLIQQRNAILDKVDAWAASPEAGEDLKAVLEISRCHHCGLLAALQPDWVPEAAAARHSLLALPDMDTMATRALKLTDFLLPLSEWRKILKQLASPIYDAGIEMQAAQVADELGGLVNWNQNSPYVEKYKRERLQYLYTIDTTTMQAVAGQVGEAITEGRENHLTVDEMANLIKDKTRGVYQVRTSHARTIARTEMGSIASATRHSIFEQEGIEKHSWLSARDEGVRYDHAQEDGHAVTVGDPFPVTGLSYPGEIGGPPEQTINCRCVARAIKS